MTHIAQYKNYTASIEYSNEDECFVGRVIGIETPIGFHGDTIEQAESEFKETMDFYIEACAEQNIKPEIPNTVFLPLPTSLYIEASQKAERKGIPVQQFMQEAVQQSMV